MDIHNLKREDLQLFDDVEFKERFIKGLESIIYVSERVENFATESNQLNGITKQLV